MTWFGKIIETVKNFSLSFPIRSMAANVQMLLFNYLKISRKSITFLVQFLHLYFRPY